MRPVGEFQVEQKIARAAENRRPQNAVKTFLKLIRYIMDKPVMLLAAAALILLSVAASIGQTYLLKPIFDRMGQANFTGFECIIKPVLLLTVLYVVEAVCVYSQSVMMARISLKGCNKLRLELFSHIQRLPIKFLDQSQHGELMSRVINDTDNIQQMLESSLVSLIQGSVSFLGMLIAMLFISWRLFFVTLITTGATALLFRCMSGLSRKKFRKRQKALGVLNSDAQEYIQGIHTVKAFHREAEAKEIFEDHNLKFRDVAAQAFFYSSGILPIASNITNSGYALTAMFGCILVLGRALSLGDLAAYLNFTRKVASPINNISQQFTAVLAALAGAERVFSIMDQPCEIDDGEITVTSAYEKDDGTLVDDINGKISAWKLPGGLCKVEGKITLSNVFFSYKEGKPVLKGISFEASAGSRIALVGATGAGKTTIVNLLNRFYEPDSGQIYYDGIDITEISCDALRSTIGVVLQDTHLFSGSVMENIRFGNPAATDEMCINAAKSIHAHTFITKLPQGYDTVISNDGNILSKGQCQLLAIARVAVANPQIIILDEATSSVDIQTEQLITEGINKLTSGRTTFIVAHRLSTVRNADKILVISDGKIAEQGSHQELLQKDGLYAALYKDSNSSIS